MSETLKKRTLKHFGSYLLDLDNPPTEMGNGQYQVVCDLKLEELTCGCGKVYHRVSIDDKTVLGGTTYSMVDGEYIEHCGCKAPF